MIHALLCNKWNFVSWIYKKIMSVNVFVDKVDNITNISCNFNWSLCGNIYTSKEFYLLPRLIVVLKYFTLFKISTRETICIFMQPICRLWLLNHILVCFFFFSKYLNFGRRHWSFFWKIFYSNILFKYWNIRFFFKKKRKINFVFFQKCETITR